ncbi:hypothetical protein [Mycobacterium sp. shizuoka-1]|uniref:hypothetical protein n=1 Tax=Mycobacterium sp. shizuoka-1 TaxID=2039281 RepID=UPI000C062C06|nr:hypothetical protein [Mycobacterium sp. shizuoka-1]GAY14181.1 hypothetical protein MSZK_09070 [Mycobacterium sp. shizuoka-1]
MPYADTDIPEELKTERLKYSATPNIKGMDAAAARICELFGIAVTASFVKLHTEQTRKLAYHKISGNRYYSDRGLFDVMHIGTLPDVDVQVSA